MNKSGAEDTALSLDHIGKSYGVVRAVDDVSFRVQTGEVLALLGPSGCGKSTTLGIVAGFIKADTGSVRIGSRDVVGVPPEKRDIGMVFQSAALFPNMSVFKNIAFGLRRRRVPTEEIKSRVGRVLELVQLQDLQHRLPRELSGGQGQRVSLARALVIDPSILLLDEPMSSLDADLRRELRRDLAELHAKTGTTTILVTHDQHEALALADRVAVMKNGAVQALASPADIVSAPPNAFTARFVTEANLMSGRVLEVNGAESLVDVQGSVTTTSTGADLAPGDPVSVAVRPAALRVELAGVGEPGVGPQGTVIGILYLVETTEVRIELAAGGVVVSQIAGRVEHLVIGSSVSIGWDSRDARPFAEAQELL